MDSSAGQEGEIYVNGEKIANLKDVTFMPNFFMPNFSAHAPLSYWPHNPEERQLIKELASLARREHYYCEDSWYSCPKATDGCIDDAMGDECNCGADEHNAKVDVLMQQINLYSDAQET